MNSLELFNSLTHEDDNVNEKVFLKLMDEFEQYLFLRNIIKKDMKISSYIKDEQLIFKIKFKEKIDSILELDNTEFKYKKKKYLAHVSKIKKKEIELYFSKE